MSWYQKPVECPFCNNLCDNAEFVDIEVGFVQCSPNFCEKCHAYEMGMNFKSCRDLTKLEKETYWYCDLDAIGPGES